MARKPASAARVIDDDDDDQSEIPLTGLEIFDDASFAGLTSYFYREAGPNEPEGANHGYCHKAYGQIDPETIARELGGGLYRVLVKDGARMHDRYRVKIAGAPKVYAPAAAVDATPAGGEIAELKALVHSLIAANKAPAPPATDPLVPMLLQAVLNRQPALDPATMFNSLAGAFNAGRDAAAGKPEGDDSMAAIVREIATGLSTFAASARGAAPAAVPGNAVPGNAAGARQSDLMEAQRAITTAVVRAFNNGRTPEETADAVETMLADEHAAQLRMLPDSSVLSQLRAGMAPMPPAEWTRFEHFVIDVLRALREPATDDDDASPTGTAG